MWDVWLTGAQHPALACALLYARLQRWDEAEACYKEAWRVNKLKRAKTKLERVRERRAQ